MENADLRPKRGGVILPWVLVAGLLGLGGYGYWFGHKPVADELQKKDVELAKANGEVQRAQGAANTAKADLDKAQDELKQAKSDLQQSAQQKDADSKLLDELKKQAGGGGDVQGQNGQITLTMVDKVLFKSGEAELSPDGEQLLMRLGGVLKSADKLVEVAGHADNQQVKSEVRELYPTNWELSAARATNVVRYLQEVVGLKPSRLKAAEYGSYRPVASNGTEKGRAKNRRIEILLLPNRIKTVKGDFSDELASADKAAPTKHVKGPTEKDRVKAMIALRQKAAPAAIKKHH
jgi:chemotaxis protein MotB